MLNLDPTVICTIISRARQLQAKDEETIPIKPSESETSDQFAQTLEHHEDDLLDEELKDGINSLEPDQQATLVALMWLGRGDYEVSEWSKAYEEAVYRANNRTAEYLMSTPLAADYMQEGLTLLGYEYEEPY